jgi:hypothetical protein
LGNAVGGSKAGGQAVVDADTLEEFGICHYIQVMVQQRGCSLVALGMSLLLHVAGEEYFFVGECRGYVVVYNCCTHAVAQVHVDMVGGQQVEKNGVFGMRSSVYLGVLVCKVTLSHAAGWSDVYVEFVVVHVGRLQCTG